MITVVDIQTNNAYSYGQELGFDRRIFLIYDGAHYDGEMSMFFLPCYLSSLSYSMWLCYVSFACVLLFRLAARSSVCAVLVDTTTVDLMGIHETAG